jgi:hypothetical protein
VADSQLQSGSGLAPLEEAVVAVLTVVPVAGAGERLRIPVLLADRPACASLPLASKFMMAPLSHIEIH